jgi:hypothetical protein
VEDVVVPPARLHVTLEFDEIERRVDGLEHAEPRYPGRFVVPWLI